MVTSLQEFVDIVAFVILKNNLDYMKGHAASSGFLASPKLFHGGRTEAARQHA